MAGPARAYGIRREAGAGEQRGITEGSEWMMDGAH